MADTDDVLPFAARFRCPHCASWLFIISDPQREYENALVHGDLLHEVASADGTPPLSTPQELSSTRTETGAGVRVPGEDPTRVNSTTPPAEQRVEASSVSCDVCGRGFKNQHAVDVHKSKAHRNDAVVEVETAPADVSLPPEPPSSPATKTRITARAVAQCVAAILDGRPVEEWADKWRFRGNIGALGAWARAVARSTDRPAYMAMDEEAREEFVVQIVRTRGGMIA